MKIKEVSIGLLGFLGGFLFNSVDVEKFGPWKFDNPIPLNANREQISKIIEKRPLMLDTHYSLDILDKKFHLATHREVFNDSDNGQYSGWTDNEGNIHTKDGEIYELQSTHDSNWYVKKH